MLRVSALLFFEFFKTGLFTFGGGFASLPFLYNICETYNWFTYPDLTQLIAISSITPGPIGLNMATYTGFKTLGIFGAIISSFALVLPMLILTSRVFKLYNKFSQNEYVESILYVLRPTSCAMICSVGVKLFYNLILNNAFSYSKINLPAFMLVFVLFISTFFLKRTPVIYMAIAGFIGIMFYFLNVL